MGLIQFDQFHFFIIHIRGSDNRFNSLKEEFNKIDIDITNNDRVHFVDGVIPDTRHKYKRRGYYGTSLGHYKAIQESIIYDHVFIIEDDVQFLDNLIFNINLTFLNLYKNDEQYDIVQFRAPRYPCDNVKCKIKDNYITGYCRFVPAEFYYLTKNIREKIMNNKEWFLNGKAVDVWYTQNLNSIKTLENYTWQKPLGSIARSNL